MTSGKSETPAAVGNQKPSHVLIPEYGSSAGDEVIALAETAGLFLDEWQQFVLRKALGERDDGQWAAFEVGLNVARQNGKNGILEALELGALFLFDLRLIVHTAHQFDTSLEAFRRLQELIESNPDFSKRVKKIKNSHGEEGIELHGGQRIRFRTRTKGGGRGFTGDLLIFDEAMEIAKTAHGALIPTLSSRPNPQIWYTGSAVDQDQHDHGEVFTRIRDRGLKGEDPSLAYFEWSAPGDINKLDDLDPEDPKLWAGANPALGIRISHEYIEREQRSLGDRAFAVERLGIGDYPALDEDDDEDRISPADWAALVDGQSEIVGPVSFVFDVRPDRSAAAIGVAGDRADGRGHLEVVDHRPGTGWVVTRLKLLMKTHQSRGIVCDASGPAASLLADCASAGLVVETVSAKEHAQAYGMFLDGVTHKSFRHLGTPELGAALAGAKRRNLGEAHAWSRKNSQVDISPLVAITLAHWHHQTTKSAATEPMIRVGK